MANQHSASVSIPEQMAVRLDKRAQLIDSGRNPYPVTLNGRVTTLKTIRDNYVDLPANHKTDDEVLVAGRVMSIRNAGKISFAVIASGDGTQLQILLSRAEIGEESHADWRKFVDLGDHISIRGLVATSMTGELSVFASEWAIISKTVRPLPNQHDDLNEETRARQRYLDLILNSDTRNRMLLRSRVISGLRSFFEKSNGYVEVETPMLQTVHGGAAARPFVTHSNAIDEDLYLRIAPELFLKRAVVGGFDRVFEINKNFRNEGMDSTHSPEFTMLEAYEVYADYNDMANLVEEAIKVSSISIDRYLGSDSEDAQHAHTVLGGLNEPWARISLYGSLSEALRISITPETSLDDLLKLAEAHKVSMATPTAGKLVEELWEELVKPGLVQPTFVFDYPVDSSPLVAAHRSIDGVVEKWDLYINGFEVATGYSELVDPVVQRERLVEQAQLAGRGDDEAMALDEEFLRALEHGMPPTGGIGIGIDRLLMILTNRGIRETVLFPLVK